MHPCCLSFKNSTCPNLLFRLTDFQLLKLCYNGVSSWSCVYLMSQVLMELPSQCLHVQDSDGQPILQHYVIDTLCCGDKVSWGLWPFRLMVWQAPAVSPQLSSILLFALMLRATANKWRQTALFLHIMALAGDDTFICVSIHISFMGDPWQHVLLYLYYFKAYII